LRSHAGPEFCAQHPDRWKADQLGDEILSAEDFTGVEAQLVQGVYKALGLASASVFRQQEHVYKRTASDPAWDNTTAKPLDPRDPMLETRKRSIRLSGVPIRPRS
jgi:hypothetical protein